MESADFSEDNHARPEGPRDSFFNPSSQTFVFYSVLCALLKSEALFTFFVYWLKGLALTSGTVGLPNYNTLSHLWLLKPLFSLLIDKLNIPATHKHEGPEGQQKVPKIVQYRPTHKFLFFNIANYRTSVLILAEYSLALSSVALYLLHLFDCFHTLYTTLLAYVLGLSLVCTSSYAEGLFCRYVRRKGDQMYVRYVSMRLALSSLYGFTTLACLLFPVLFHTVPLAKFFQINFFFPLFLVLNCLFVSWLVSRPFLTTQSSNLRPASPSSPLQLDPKDVESPDTFSLECLFSLLVLLLVSMRLKNDFFNRYTTANVDRYLFVLSTQFFKFLASLLILKFVGPRALMRLCMGVFALALGLLYPLKSYTLMFFEHMSKLGRYNLLLLGFFLSFVQQVLLAYALLISLLISPPGIETTVLSLPSFVAHFTQLCLRQNVLDYLDLSPNQRSVFQFLGLFLFSYCFSVLFNINHSEFIDKCRSLSRRLREDRGAWKLKEERGQKAYPFHLTKALYGSQDPKSPWEQRSELSYDSDAL